VEVDSPAGGRRGLAMKLPCTTLLTDILGEMADNEAVVVRRLHDAIVAARHADGGWGYGADKAARLEPTSWALLALLDCGIRLPNSDLSGGVSSLSRWQQSNGLLSDAPHGMPNLAFNGLAALVLRRMQEQTVVNAPGDGHVETRLLEGIRATKGVRTGASTFNRQDNRLQGWPWVNRTFSWVEPTAWCLLALKKARRATSDGRFDARIDEGNRLLIDRCCREGGWNYGNSNMFGKELHPYVPTTAVALLALQDHRSAPEVSRSLRWIRENGNGESSGLALSLALILAHVYHEPNEGLERCLCDEIARKGSPANPATTAMALYALTGSHHAAAAVTI